MLEAAVKKAVKKRLNELGCYQFWPVQMGYGSVTLDCLGIYQGKGFAIETKAPGKKPTPLQQNVIEAIKSAGGVVLVIDNIEDAATFTL